MSREKKESLLEEIDIDNQEEPEEEEVVIKGKELKKLKLTLVAEPPKLVDFILNLRRQMAAIRRMIANHINEPSAEIRVKVRDGSWGDWAGLFYADNDEKIEVLKNKIEEHFDRNFKQIKDKEFAFIINCDGEKETYKTIKTNEKELKKK